MKAKDLFLCAMSLLFTACSGGAGSKVIHQSSRDNIVDISGDLKPFPLPDSIMISNSNSIMMIGKYFVINDYNNYSPIDNWLYFFDSQTMRFVNSAIKFGEGPNEIAVLGTVSYVPAENSLLVADNARYVIYKYDLAQLLASPKTCEPIETYDMNESAILSNLIPIDADEGMTALVKPITYQTYNLVLARYNYKTGEYHEYEIHPEIKGLRFIYDVSVEKNLCAVANTKYDLLTLTDLDGNILKDIEGPMWGTEKRVKPQTYSDVMITRNHIVAPFSGDKWASGKVSQLLVFTLDGEYVETLDVGSEVKRTCYDESTGRIYMSLDDDPQFVYYELEE